MNEMERKAFAFVFKIVWREISQNDMRNETKFKVSLFFKTAMFIG